MISILFSLLIRYLNFIVIFLSNKVFVQLKSAIDSGDAFTDYEEGPIMFPPTYRYDLGTDKYDTSEKMRIPAWTGITLDLEPF